MKGSSDQRIVKFILMTISGWIFLGMMIQADADDTPPSAKEGHLGMGFYFGPSLLLVRFDTQENVQNPGLQFKTGLSRGSVFYYGLNSHATVELNLTQSGVSGRISNFNFGTDTNPNLYHIDIDVNVIGFSTDLQYGYPIHFFYPYFRLGIGYYFSDFSMAFTSVRTLNESSTEGQDNSIGYLMGFGLDIAPISVIHFGIEGRFNITFPEGITIAAFAIYPRLVIQF